jgi:acetyl esterase/lipase
MAVTKKMYHKEIESSIWALKLMTTMLLNKNGMKMINKVGTLTNGKKIKGLHCEEIYIPSRNGGADIRVRIFKPLNSSHKLPGMLYLHGGGLVMGNPESALSVIEKFIKTKPCVIIAPDYRKAFDAPYPAAFNDCYDTLLWIDENADQLGVIKDKLIVAGHSAGGGLTSAITLKASQTHDVKIAFQIPVYPMLDDRQDTNSATDNDAPIWNSKTNKIGWSAYLSDLIKQGAEIPAYAAPARTVEFSILPPTISFVGDMEPFKDETIAYIQNLRKAGIAVEFKLFNGCFHGFETILPKLEISKEAWAFLLDSYGSYVEKFIYSK